MGFTAKRFRDIGISGWFSLPYVAIALTALLASMLASSLLIKAISATILILTVLGLLLWPGKKYDTKYGPYDPFTI